MVEVVLKYQQFELVDTVMSHVTCFSFLGRAETAMITNIVRLSSFIFYVSLPFSC
jgi:hypothetical protein